MIDLMNRPLYIGDSVVINPPKYKGLVRAEIVGFTKQMVKVKYSAPWVYEYVDGQRVNWAITNVRPQDVVKADVAPKTKIVKNFMTGENVEIDVDTPRCCDPSSETYWTM